MQLMLQLVLTACHCYLWPGSLDGFLKAYIAKYRYGTVTTDQWKEFFLEFFSKEV